MSVKCNETVEVVAAQTVTLNCTIDPKNCTGVRYHWDSTQSDILCNSGLKYRCEWDRLTYVSLTISNVTKEENYTVRIQTDCAVTKPSTIKVQVIPSSKIFGEGEDEATQVLPLVLGIFIALIALGILYFLFGTDRGRGIMKCIKKQRIPGDDTDNDTTPGSGDSLIV